MTGVMAGTSSGVVTVILCLWRKALASESEARVVVVSVVWGTETFSEESDSCFRLLSFLSFRDGSLPSNVCCEELSSFSLSLLDIAILRN